MTFGFFADCMLLAGKVDRFKDAGVLGLCEVVQYLCAFGLRAPGCYRSRGV